MTAHPIALAAQTTTEPSTWDTIKTNVSDAASWCGRQICWLGSVIADSVVAVVEWAKPFFIRIGQFFAEQYENIREWVVENKQVSIIAAVSVLGTIVVGFASYFLCCTGDGSAES